MQTWCRLAAPEGESAPGSLRTGHMPRRPLRALAVGRSIPRPVGNREGSPVAQNCEKNVQIALDANGGTVWPPANSHHVTGRPGSQPEYATLIASARGGWVVTLAQTTGLTERRTGLTTDRMTKLASSVA
jgi:hypothetical protein